MADAGGALEAAQQAAGEVVYKNMAAVTPAENLLNSWATATQLKLKKQEIMGKMSALETRNRQLEFMDQLREKQYAQRAYMDQARLNLAEGKADFANQTRLAQLGLEGQRLDIAQGHLNLAAERQQGQDEATATMVNAEAQLASEGIYPGDKRFISRYNELVGSAIGKAPHQLVNSVLKTTYTNSNQASYQRLRNQELSEKMFRERFGSDVYGNPAIQDTSYLNQPWESLPDETKVTGTWPFRSTVPTGRKQLPSVDPSGRTIQKPITIQQFNDFKKQWSDLQKQRGEIGTPVDAPELGVSSVNPAIQQGRDAIAAAKAKGVDITPQVKERLQKMGLNPNDL